MDLIGYLKFDQEGEQNQFFRFNKTIYQNTPRLSGVKELSPFSVVDGEGGMGGNLTHNLGSLNGNPGPGGVPDLSSSPRRIAFKETEIPIEDFEQGSGFSYDVIIRTVFLAGPQFTGTINSRFIPSNDQSVRNDMAFTVDRSYIPLMQGGPNIGLNTLPSDSFQFPYSFYFSQAVDWPFVIDFNQKHSYIELLGVPFLFIPGGGGAIYDPNSSVDRTFKFSGRSFS